MKQSGKKLRILSICVFTMLIAGLAYGSELVDRIVAVVNEDIISLFELNQTLKPFEEKLKDMNYPPDKEREMMFKLREETISKLIDQKLTDQEVKKLNISVSEQEIDKAIERIKEMNYFTDEDLRSVLGKEGLTLEDYRVRLREEILRSKLVSVEVRSKIVITNDDIKAYMDKNPDKSGSEKKYHLRNILKKPLSFGSEIEKNALRYEMQDILLKLKKGESFEALAKKYSDAPTAAEGGELGTFELDKLAPQIRDAVKDLKAGQYTDVMETEQGYQIFFVQEIISSKAKSVDEVRAQVEDKLYKEIVEQKFRAWLENLRKQATIKIIK